MKKVTTLYLDAEAYEELKQACSRLNITVSEKMNKMVKQAVAELTGKRYEEAVSSLDYQALHREYQRVVRDLDKLQNKLLKKGVYKDLAQLALKVGLDRKDYTNAAEISSEFLNQWTGPKEHALEFVNVMETAKRKHEVERLLDDAIARRSQKPKPHHEGITELE